MNKFLSELKRRHVFKAAISYIVIAWVFLQAAAIIFPILGLSNNFLRGCLILLVIGFPFWLIFAFVFDITPEGIKKTEDVSDNIPDISNTSHRQNKIIIGGLTIAVLLLLVDKVFNITSFPNETRNSKIQTIAVLPFQNMSPDEENEFFVKGVHEDVMNRLASLKSVRVICKTSVNKYTNYEGDLKTIADRLNANYIMEGSVRRIEGQVRITAQLVDAKSNQMIWSDTYDRKLENIFELQSAIAKEIANKMQATISKDDFNQLKAKPTVVMAAYDNFLKARNIYNQSWVPYEGIMETIDYLKLAVEQDPNFADAWSLLAEAQSDRYYTVIDFDGRDEEVELAKKEATTALKNAENLDPEGLSYFKAKAVYELEIQQDKVASLRSLDKALTIQPDDPDALFLQGFLAFKLGQLDKSMLSVERAFELDQENGRIAYFLTTAYEMNREYDKMVPFFEKLLKLEPEKTHYGVQAKYYQFLADGKLSSYKSFENAVKTVEKTDQCDSRSIQDNEMVVAMFSEDFQDYATAWAGKWDSHHKNHGNWSCPMILNEEANHAKLLIEHGHDNELAFEIIGEARNSTARPIDENSLCIFNKAVYEPKLDIMEGDTLAARKKFDDVVFDVIRNDKFPRGAVEKVVLLQTADMVAPERVFSIYRQVLEAPVTLVGMESVCANPWLYPNLIKDPLFMAEVKADGRFVEFLKHYGYWHV